MHAAFKHIMARSMSPASASTVPLPSDNASGTDSAAAQLHIEVENNELHLEVDRLQALLASRDERVEDLECEVEDFKEQVQYLMDERLRGWLLTQLKEKEKRVRDLEQQVDEFEEQRLLRKRLRRTRRVLEASHCVPWCCGVPETDHFCCMQAGLAPPSNSSTAVISIDSD